MCPRTKPLYVCPHAKARYVSSILSLYVCVLIRECLLFADAAATGGYMRMLRSDSVCPHTKPPYLSSYEVSMCVSSYKASMHVSSYSASILSLFMCPHRYTSAAFHPDGLILGTGCEDTFVRVSSFCQSLYMCPNTILSICLLVLSLWYRLREHIRSSDCLAGGLA